MKEIFSRVICVSRTELGRDENKIRADSRIVWENKTGLEKLHKPKYFSLETRASGSCPHFARFASETVNKAPTSDQRGRRSLQPGLGPHPPGPTLLHSFLHFFFFPPRTFWGRGRKAKSHQFIRLLSTSFVSKGRGGR